MQLWIVRHAIAADYAPHSDADFDRPLTDKGRRKFTALADFLVAKRGAPVRILCSPLVRTVQTAELLAHAAGIKKSDLEIYEQLAPGVNVGKLLEILYQQSAEVVAIVGHEPDMSRCTSEFIGGGQIAFGKGHIACVEFQDTPARGTAVLKWFVDPQLVG